ncbi:tetratricopeptide repeat protein [Candidatus Thorarchaeota archaeon]|nr:MAG: tetratricopeptide repeat protein [Candidatus Thorarchaeota archaeon]
MKSVGSITKYFPFVTAEFREFIQSRIHETDTLADLKSELVEHVVSSETLHEEILHCTILLILDLRDPPSGFRIEQRYPDDPIVKFVMDYARGVMGDRDAIDRAIEVASDLRDTDIPSFLLFKVIIVESLIRSNWDLGGESDMLRDLQQLMNDHPELRSLEYEYLWCVGEVLVKDDPGQQLDVLTKSVEGSRDADDLAILGFAVNSLAVVMLRYDVGKSIELLEESYEINKILERAAMMAIDLNNLGYTRVIIGEYDEAIDYYSRAIELNQSLGFPDYTPMMNLAVIYGNLGMIDRALEYAQLAVKTQEESGVPAAAPRTEMARALALAGRIDEATEYVESGGEVAFQLKSKRELGRYYLVRGMIDREQGDIDQAISMFRRGLRIADAEGNPYHILQILLQLAETEAIRFAEMGNEESAAASSIALSRMEQITEEQNLPGLSIQVALLKSDFEILKGNKANAHVYLEQARSMSEEANIVSLKGIIDERFEKLEETESKPSLIQRFKNLVRRIVVPQVKPKEVPFEILGLLLILKGTGLQVYVRYVDKRLKSDPSLVAGLITAVSAFANELREDATGDLESIVHQDIAVLLEHGRYVTGALLADRDTYQARALERAFIEVFENEFSEKLGEFDGNVSSFSRADPMFDAIVIERKSPVEYLE